MARINIEDDIFQDKRFFNFAKKIGDFEKAIGALVFLWKASQNQFLKNDGWISPEKWIELDLNDALKTSGFCENDAHGNYRVKNPEKHFGWMRKRVESASKGGKKSAQSRQEKYGTTRPITEKSTKQTRSEREAVRSDVNPLTLTPTLTLSPSLATNSSSSINTIAQKKLENDALAKDSESKYKLFQRDVISCFKSAWSKKYGANYKLLPKEIGQIKQLSGSSIDEVKTLINAYLEMHEGIFISKRHDFMSFILNLPKISHYAQTGLKVSRHDVNAIETQEHNKNTWAKAFEEMRSKKNE